MSILVITTYKYCEMKWRNIHDEAKQWSQAAFVVGTILYFCWDLKILHIFYIKFYKLTTLHLCCTFLHCLWRLPMWLICVQLLPRFSGSPFLLSKVEPIVLDEVFLIILTCLNHVQRTMLKTSCYPPISAMCVFPPFLVWFFVFFKFSKVICRFSVSVGLRAFFRSLV